MADMHDSAATIKWYRTPIPREALTALNRRSDFKGVLQAGGYLALLIATGSATLWSAFAGAWGCTPLLLFLHGTVGAFNLNYAANERVNVNVNVAYNGSQNDTFFPPFPRSPEQVTLASYTLVTLAAGYQMTPRLEIFGRIENLLDEDYEDVYGFNTPGIGAFIGIRAQH